MRTRRHGQVSNCCCATNRTQTICLCHYGKVGSRECQVIGCQQFGIRNCKTDTYVSKTTVSKTTGIGRDRGSINARQQASI